MYVGCTRKSDKLKKNGTFKRGLFFLLGGVIVYRIIKIQTMLWSKANGQRVYISVFPSNVIKYNKVDTGLIEFISSNVKEGEYVFQYVDDSGDAIDCEDILIRSCYRVERACMSRSLSALLNSRFTEILNKTISTPTPPNISNENSLRCASTVPVSTPGV